MYRSFDMRLNADIKAYFFEVGTDNFPLMSVLTTGYRTLEVITT